MGIVELTRIYQGRILSVEVGGQQLPSSKWQRLIWQQHVLFQDAVNYYSLCLAAMARGAEALGEDGAALALAATRSVGES